MNEDIDSVVRLAFFVGFIGCALAYCLGPVVPYLVDRLRAKWRRRQLRLLTREVLARRADHGGADARGVAVSAAGDSQELAGHAVLGARHKGRR